MGPKKKITQRRIPPPQTIGSDFSDSSSPVTLSPVSSPSSSRMPKIFNGVQLNGVVKNIDFLDSTDSDEKDNKDNNDKQERSSSDENVDKLSPISSTTMAVKNLNLHGLRTRPFTKMPVVKRPPYKDMITEALKAYDDKQGSSYTHIEKWIKDNYPESVTSRSQASIKKAITAGIDKGIFVLTNKQANWTGRLKYVSPTKTMKSKLKPKPKKPVTKQLDLDEGKENGKPALTKTQKKTESNQAKDKKMGSKRQVDRRQPETDEPKTAAPSTASLPSTSPVKSINLKKVPKNKSSVKAPSNEQASLHPEGLKQVAKRTLRPTKYKLT